MESILHKQPLPMEGNSNGKADDFSEYHVPMEPQIHLSGNSASSVPTAWKEKDPVSGCVLAGMVLGTLVGGLVGFLALYSLKELLLIGATAGLVAGMAVGLMRRYLEFHNTSE